MLFLKCVVCNIKKLVFIRKQVQKRKRQVGYGQGK